MCDDCGWQSYKQAMEDALGVGLNSQFVDAALEHVTKTKHITPREKAGVDRWIKHWTKRQDLEF